MSARVFQLSGDLRLHRVGHQQYPLWDGQGAAIVGGRWNSVGQPVVYAASSYALALLETLVRLDARSIPRSFVRSELTIPVGATALRVQPKDLPGWDSDASPQARAFGNQWLRQGQSLLLMVPSVVVEGIEENVLLNPSHPEFRALSATPALPVRWDQRLLPQPGHPHR